MQKSKELEQNIDNIKYDIETLEMEKIGLIRKFRFLKEKLVINFVILILIFLFINLKIIISKNTIKTPNSAVLTFEHHTKYIQAII